MHFLSYCLWCTAPGSVWNSELFLMALQRGWGCCKCNTTEATLHTPEHWVMPIVGVLSLIWQYRFHVLRNSIWPSAANLLPFLASTGPLQIPEPYWKENWGEQVWMLLRIGSCKHSPQLSWLLSAGQAKNIWLSGKAVRLPREEERRVEKTEERENIPVLSWLWTILIRKFSPIFTAFLHVWCPAIPFSFFPHVILLYTLYLSSNFLLVLILTCHIQIVSFFITSFYTYHLFPAGYHTFLALTPLLIQFLFLLFFSFPDTADSQSLFGHITEGGSFCPDE